MLLMCARGRPNLGLNGLTVSTSEAPNDVVSLSTVSPVDPAAVEGGLPGLVVFATMLNSVSVIVAWLCELSGFTRRHSLFPS